MGEKEHGNQKVMWVLKSLLASYVISGMLLVLLSLLLYKFNLSQAKVTVGIIIVYVISTFCGAFILGKLMEVKQYLWGLALGLLYFTVLLLITVGVYGSLEDTQILSTLILCMASGTIGGMLS